MAEIICDTNIWYNIAKDKIKYQDLDKHSLVLTQVVVQELATSPRLINSPEIFIKTCEAALRLSKLKNLINPYQYLIGYPFVDNFTFRSILSMNTFISNPNEVKKVYDNEDDLNEVKKVGKGGIEHKNNYTELFKEQISIYIKANKLTEKNSRRNYRKNYNPEWRKKDIVSLFGFSEQEEGNIYWDKHEFFLTVFNYWMIGLVTGKSQYDKNDWGDYLNLVYVGKGMKYYTHEKKWILLIWDSGMQDYLFRDEAVNGILKKNNKV